jgi:hypothetical protein
VQIWIENKLDLNGGAFITESGSAADLEIYVGDFRRSPKVMALEVQRLVEAGVLTLNSSGGNPIDQDGVTPEEVLSSELTVLGVDPDEYVAGDYNGDGEVDLADQTYYTYYGDPGETAYVGRDYNGDGVIDETDYTYRSDSLELISLEPVNELNIGETDPIANPVDPGVDYGLDYNDGINPYPSDSDNFYLWNSVYAGWTPAPPPADAADADDDDPAGEVWALKRGHVRMRHGGVFVGKIYAPSSTVCIKSDADACGSIIAREIVISQGGAFHFDERLMSAPVNVASRAFIKTVW